MEWVQRKAIKMIKRKESQSDKKRYGVVNMFSLKKKRVEDVKTHFKYKTFATQKKHNTCFSTSQSVGHRIMDLSCTETVFG